MKKFLLLLIGLAFWQFGYSQQYKYEFKVDGVTDPGTAKGTIAQIRDLMGVRVVTFDDSEDRFIVLTDHDMNPSEMIEKFEGNGVVIVGDINKINLE